MLVGILFVFISGNMIVSRGKGTFQSRIYYIAALILIYIGIDRLGLFDNYIHNEFIKFLAILFCTHLILVTASFLSAQYQKYRFKKKRFK